MRQIYISLTIGADFVPLVPLSMPVSCPLCRVPRRFRAARAAFHAGFVPLVPLVPRSAPVSCRSCRFPRRFRAACAARASFVKRYVGMRQDMSRYVQMCQDMSRDVKICQEMSRRYHKSPAEREQFQRPSRKPCGLGPSPRPSAYSQHQQQQQQQQQQTATSNRSNFEHDGR